MIRHISVATVLALGLVTSGCNYGFVGGGFPSHIRTVYIEAFDNQSAQFDLDQQLTSMLMERIPRALGVQPAGRESADAILTGAVVHYDDLAQSFRAGQVGGGVRQVQVAIRVQIVDVSRNVILWQQQRLVGRGEYDPDTQTDMDARVVALENLVDQIVDGAQAQW